MTELLIIPDKGALKTPPVLLYAILLFFTVTSYLGKGFNTATLGLLCLTIALTASMFWSLYIASKKRILINKASKQIEIITYTFFGARQENSYPIMYFGSIRSYISLGGGSRNVVELITNDGTRSLHLSSFLPHGRKQFWTMQVATENPEAAKLVNAITDFIPLQNLGFCGYHFGKFPLEKNGAGFIKNIFK